MNVLNTAKLLRDVGNLVSKTKPTAITLRHNTLGRIALDE